MITGSAFGAVTGSPTPSPAESGGRRRVESTAPDTGHSSDCPEKGILEIASRSSESPQQNVLEVPAKSPPEQLPRGAIETAAKVPLSRPQNLLRLNVSFPPRRLAGRVTFQQTHANRYILVYPAGQPARRKACFLLRRSDTVGNITPKTAADQSILEIKSRASGRSMYSRPSFHLSSCQGWRRRSLFHPAGDGLRASAR